MIDFDKKGFFNIHTLLTKDDVNLSNKIINIYILR
jgi:hypothetical protein